MENEIMGIKWIKTLPNRTKRGGEAKRKWDYLPG